MEEIAAVAALPRNDIIIGFFLFEQRLLVRLVWSGWGKW